MLRLTLIAALSMVTATWAQEAGKAYLGVTIDDLTPQSRFKHKVPGDVTAGAVLTTVVKGTPAANAGFRAGDVIVEIDGQPIRTRTELIESIQAKRAGTVVSYRIRRGTGVISGKIRLGARTPPEPRSIRRMVPIEPMQEAPKKERRKPPAPRHGNLEKRLDNVQGEIALLRKRLLEVRRKKAPLHHPRSLGGWAHEEEQAIRRARADGDEKRAHYHAIRLSVLKEMQETRFQLPARRLDRVEKKLDQILERLDRLEK